MDRNCSSYFSVIKYSTNYRTEEQELSVGFELVNSSRLCQRQPKSFGHTLGGRWLSILVEEAGDGDGGRKAGGLE